MTPADFPSIADIDPEAQARELKRLEEIERLAAEAVKRNLGRPLKYWPEKQVVSDPVEIVADYLAGVNCNELRKKYGGKGLYIAIRNGTTLEQRKQIELKKHRDRERESQRRKRGSSLLAHTIIPVGPYRSIREAADAAGISETAARRYHDAGVPLERWSTEHERTKERRVSRIEAIPVGKFPSIRAAARAADISSSAARRLFKRHIPPEKWAETIGASK